MTTQAQGEAELDALDAADRARPEPTMVGAALYYALRGLRVFPLQPGAKIPFAGSRGCKDATTDVERVRAWWHPTFGNPDANVGIATGHLIDVVDIDGAVGQASRAQHWEDLFGRIDDDAIAKVLTPRPGGMHLYVPATGDGNAAGIVPGVDYRGAGGYVLAPPSVIAPGGKDAPGRYRFLGTPALDGLV